MISGVNFHASLLILVNVLGTIAKGSSKYEASKAKLNVAVKEYDQAVMDLTASIVSCSHSVPVKIYLKSSSTRYGAEEEPT